MAEKHTGQKEVKPYTAPVLTEYGSVEDLTRGGGGVASDFPNGSSKSG
ncbi:MAG: lasso RiPP family leader peptide-containing protein [Acidobacteria bacterium]|nr:lasso RiPP family leader peptide-containing protein [Acidobacteriota bacterium]